MLPTQLGHVQHLVLKHQSCLLRLNANQNGLSRKEIHRNVANTAWACATLGVEAPKLFAEIERRSKWLVEEGNPQAVANTAWAFATLGYQASELFIELDRHADRLIENANLQDISNTCYAIASFGQEQRIWSLC